MAKWRADIVDGSFRSALLWNPTKKSGSRIITRFAPCSLHTLAFRWTVELDRKKIQATYPVFSSDKICCRVEAKHQTKQPWE